MARRRRRSADRRLAIQALRRMAMQHLGDDARITNVEHLGAGVYRKTWACTVTGPDGFRVDWVAQVPVEDNARGDLERFRKELGLLKALSGHELPFRKPLAIGRVVVDGRPVNISTRCPGAQLRMKGTFFLDAASTCDLLGRLAADVHRLPHEGLPFPHRVFESAEDDALDAIECIRELDAPFIDDVLDWCDEHMPDPDAPVVFLHGDLLAKNVRYVEGEPPALVDWEFAGTGDAASDLAVITRGVRRPFGLVDGARRLLEAYDEHADRPVGLAALRFQELALVADEAASFIADYPHSTEKELGRLRRLFRLTLKEQRPRR